MNACDVIELRKLVTCIKNDKNQMAFPHLNLNSIELITYADGSFNNLPNGRSQGGHIIFPTDNGKNCCPLIWNSSKFKRVVRSTLAAEVLALGDGCESAMCISKI